MIKIFGIVLLLCTSFTYAEEKNTWLYTKGGRVEAKLANDQTKTVLSGAFVLLN